MEIFFYLKQYNQNIFEFCFTFKVLFISDTLVLISSNIAVCLNLKIKKEVIIFFSYP